MSNPTSARAMRRAKARKQAGEIRRSMRREARAGRRIHVPPVGSIFTNLWRRMQRSKTPELEL